MKKNIILKGNICYSIDSSRIIIDVYKRQMVYYLRNEDTAYVLNGIAADEDTAEAVYTAVSYTHLSHDVVAKLRGILKQKKIGHTGTLDPDAEGVLPVCLGRATKLCDLLTDKDKTYRAVMLLGTVTDTQDISGTVLQKKEVNVSEEEVQEAIRSFEGAYDQIRCV